ncbi:extracellular solute-binding protein [Gammaproteobacteria bacterium]|nr:extracellular solute-binding protein [Gammaproteobacteria bacterium]
MKYTKLFCLLVLVSSCAQQDDIDQLTIYTSRQPQLIEPLLEQYKSLTGIDVALLSGNATQLMERIIVEGDATEADIFMTVDAGVLWQAGEKGIFENIESEILSQNIPQHLRDADGKWFGLSKRARTIVYSSDAVNSDDLSSYEDLALPKWNNKLCLRTSTKVYNRSLIASMIDAQGLDHSKMVVQGWVNNLATEVFSSDTQVLKAVSAGQCAVTIVNTYYLARLADDPQYSNLKLYWANQKSRGTHVNISGAGVVKSSKNKDAATKLLEWLSSEEAQESYADANKEFPVKSGIQVGETLKGWGEFKEDLISVEKLGSLQKEAVLLAQQAGYK